MTTYKLEITRIDDNPKFDAKKYERDQRRTGPMYDYGEPPVEGPYLLARRLYVELTESEYEAIKAAVLKEWK